MTSRRRLWRNGCHSRSSRCVTITASGDEPVHDAFQTRHPLANIGERAGDLIESRTGLGAESVEIGAQIADHMHEHNSEGHKYAGIDESGGDDGDELGGH